MGPTPQQLSVEAIQGLTADVGADLSVYGRSAVSALTGALSGVLGTELGGIDPVARAAVGAAMDAAVVIAQNVLSATATELATYAGEIAGDVVEAVPIVGQIVGLFITIGTAMQKGANAAAAAAAAHKRQECLDSYRPVVGSGALNARVPADYFAGRNRGLNAHFTAPGLPSVGLAFVRVVTAVGPQGEDQGEGPLDSLLPDPIRVSRAWAPATADRDWLRARTNYAVLSARARRDLHDKRIGIPLDRIYVMWRLLLAIQAQHQSFAPPGVVDGGAALWPILIDLMRGEFEAGRLTEPYVRYLWERWGYCARLDDRGLRELLELVRGWTSYVHPFYLQDRPAAAVLAKRPAAVATAAGLIARRMSSSTSPLRLAPEAIARIADAWQIDRPLVTTRIPATPSKGGGAAVAFAAGLGVLLLARGRGR